MALKCKIEIIEDNLCYNYLHSHALDVKNISFYSQRGCIVYTPLFLYYFVHIIIVREMLSAILKFFFIVNLSTITVSLKQSNIFFFQIILIHWTQSNGASLPKWVHLRDSCPDPTNISQWMQASESLNCLHDLSSTDRDKQKHVYQCMPSSFFNETVEFCGRNVPIEPGTGIY